MAIGSLKQLAPLADGLIAAAEHTAFATRAKWVERHRKRAGAGLRPGSGTPLWNELAAAVQKALRRRGEKAKLARLIGVSRQRLHLLVVAKSACPDAERTLRLLVWLQARQRGIDPG